MTTFKSIDFTQIILFLTIVAGLVGLVYCVGALVVMMVGLNIVSFVIVLVALVGAVMVIVRMIKEM